MDLKQTSNLMLNGPLCSLVNRKLSLAQIYETLTPHTTLIKWARNCILNKLSSTIDNSMVFSEKKCFPPDNYIWM